MTFLRSGAHLAQQPQRRFVFGSSMPRELTHLSSVPPVLRAIDSQSKQEIAKRSTSMSASLLLFEERPKVDVRHYVIETHQPIFSKNDLVDFNPFAFGLPTPLEFSHLNKVQNALRVYDAKVVVKSDQSALSSNVYRKPRSISAQVRSKSAPAKVENNISSEPDVVRWYDNYLDILKLQQINGMTKCLKPSRTSTAKANVIARERAIDLAVETSVSMKVITTTYHGIFQEPVVIAPVVVHDDSNLVLIEDNNVFKLIHEAHNTAVMSLSDLSDLGKSRTLSSPHKIKNVIDKVLEKVESIAGVSNTQLLILADEPANFHVHTLDNNPIEEEPRLQTFS